jgi:hypothetical protein
VTCHVDPDADADADADTDSTHPLEQEQTP